jgi:NitT/TauT family transport system permease protein
MIKTVKPFEKVKRRTQLAIQFGWLIAIIAFWVACSFGETHLFPTPKQVMTGFSDLYGEGLVVHLASSLWLCAQAVFYSVIISLLFCYLSPLPLLRPIANTISKLRYLPLTGIAFYMSILISGARTLQVWVLVVFMSTFFITSILSMLNDIPEEEFDHARTLGCNRWEILWEVVIKGRFDYVIEMIRQNLAIVWMMLVTVESILVAAGGLGFLIKNSDKTGNQGRVIAIQIIIIFVGLFLDFILTYTRKLLFRYSKI